MNSLTVDEFFRLSGVQRALVLGWLKLHDINPDTTVRLQWDNSTLTATQYKMFMGKPVTKGGDIAFMAHRVPLRAPLPLTTTHQEPA